MCSSLANYDRTERLAGRRIAQVLQSANSYGIRFNLAVYTANSLYICNATAQNNAIFTNRTTRQGSCRNFFFWRRDLATKAEDENSHLHHYKSLVSVTLNHHNILPDEIRYFAGLKTIQHLKIGEIPDEATISTEAVSCIRLMPELRSLSISTESDLTSLKWIFLNRCYCLSHLKFEAP